MADAAYDIKKNIAIKYLQRQQEKHRLGLFCIFHGLLWDISELRAEIDKKDISQDKLELIYGILKL